MPKLRPDLRQKKDMLIEILKVQELTEGEICRLLHISHNSANMMIDTLTRETYMYEDEQHKIGRTTVTSYGILTKERLDNYGKI